MTFDGQRRRVIVPSFRRFIVGALDLAQPTLRLSRMHIYATHAARTRLSNAV